MRALAAAAGSVVDIAHVLRTAVSRRPWSAGQYATAARHRVPSWRRRRRRPNLLLSARPACLAAWLRPAACCPAAVRLNSFTDRLSAVFRTLSLLLYTSLGHQTIVRKSYVLQLCLLTIRLSPCSGALTKLYQR